ncbi:MAG: hypothetical protein ACC619_02105 [Paracoccaceae bacterium]
MAGYNDAYSRLILWLKIALPLIALSILSTLFLISEAIDPSLPIRFANVDVQELAREQIIGGPTFSGVTIDGAAITVSAASARPQLNGAPGLSANELFATIRLPDGINIDMSAKIGSIDSVANVSVLAGDVVVQASSGYRIQTDRIVANLYETSLISPGAITASGPLGQISAGQMVLRQSSRTDGPASYDLVFNNGVKLIYTPRQ